MIETSTSAVPKRLLSKNHYRLINFKNVLKRNCLLLRRPLSDDIFTDAGQIRPTSVIDIIVDEKQKKNPAHKMSLSLLGVFQIDDLYYNCGIGYFERCISELAKVLDVPTYKFSRSSIVAVYPKSIHSIDFEYVDLVEAKETYQEEWKSLKGKQDLIQEFKKKRLKGITKVLHTPVLMNFWHYEWRFFREDGREFPGTGSEELERIVYLRKIESWITEHFIQYNENLDFGTLRWYHYWICFPCWLKKLWKYITSKLSK